MSKVTIESEEQSAPHGCRPVAERIAELEKDPKKKAALDAARQRIKEQCVGDEQPSELFANHVNHCDVIQILIDGINNKFGIHGAPSTAAIQNYLETERDKLTSIISDSTNDLVRDAEMFRWLKRQASNGYPAGKIFICAVSMCEDFYPLYANIDDAIIDTIKSENLVKQSNKGKRNGRK